MFESLSDRLGASLKAISGKSKLTEDNIRDTLRDVRMTLVRGRRGVAGGKNLYRSCQRSGGGNRGQQESIAGPSFPESGAGGACRRSWVARARV